VIVTASYGLRDWSCDWSCDWDDSNAGAIRVSVVAE